jgi:hypothetical protein
MGHVSQFFRSYDKYLREITYEKERFILAQRFQSTVAWSPGSTVSGPVVKQKTWQDLWWTSLSPHGVREARK